MAHPLVDRQPARIEVGGRHYAHAGRRTLASGVDGTFRVKRNRRNTIVTFYAADGQAFGYAAVERGHSSGWFGTAFRTPEGCYYMHGATEATEKALGIAGMNVGAEGALAARVVNEALRIIDGAPESAASAPAEAA